MLDLANPLNRSHPLAAGLQFGGVVTLGASGQTKLYNVCDWPGMPSGRHGTLTATLSGAVGFGGSGRTGGFGEFKGNNGTEYVQIADHQSLKLATSFTVALSLRVPANMSGCVLSKFSNGAGSSGSDLRGIRYQSGTLYCSEAGGNPLSWATFTEQWFHLAVVSTASGSTLYGNGNAVATGASLTAWFNNAGPIRLGAAEAAFFGSGSAALIGKADGVLLWNRPLSRQEVQLVWALSQQGYPGLLRRAAPRRYASAAGGGSRFFFGA
jgi:hypothetical protein